MGVLNPPMARKIIIVALATLILTGPVKAAEFDKGFEAYGRGDYAAAFETWLALGRGGHPHAQYNLGQMYRRGQGISRDLAEAAVWYRRAAMRNHRSAQYNLGSMYVRGLGIPRDDIQGYKWFALAAAQGDGEAIANRDLLAKRMSAAEIAAAAKLLAQAKAARRTAPKTAPETGPKNQFQVQFGAMENRENAEREATSLKAAHGDALGNLKLAVIPTDLGERGRFYRVRAEPMGDRATADEACLRFKRRAVHCFVAPQLNTTSQ